MAVSITLFLGSSNLLDQDVLSLESSDPAVSVLLAPFSQRLVDVVDEGDDSVKSYHPASPAHRELLEFMDLATARLDLV